jgi:hypothetical protein
MKKSVKWIIAGSVIGLIAIVTISLIGYNWRVDNRLKDNKNLFLAQYDVCKISHDEMWKIISQDAQISEKYVNSYAEKVLPALVAGRKADGEIMRWITEANPNYDAEKLFSKLMDNVEIERKKFTRAQTRAIDIRKEIMNMIENKPECLFVDKKYKEYTIVDGVKVYADEQVQQIYSYKPVTSTKTEKVFETGKDDDVQVF